MAGLPSRVYPVVANAAQVESLVDAGARLIQLRIKQEDGAALRDEVARALACCRRHDACLVINDHWRLAIELAADWLHLGQEDLQTADVAAIRQAGLRLGVSTHSDDELSRALSVSPDYVALGPIYPTTLKQMRFGPQGLQRITQWKQRVAPRPLVAIGGITLERATGCLEAGADCVAAVSGLLAAPDPAARLREWLAALEPAALAG